ncbi:hypothetical protein KFK09_019682 [Dendrobium nobile]|uniref:Uncharacterized protein n=1 Tax=Dendrobium nobile TaxID=94219 RepID=A0A8T3AR39_DENNO|nr:hypothetical protein KFK09_019682 [Dendrobium nobile]
MNLFKKKKYLTPHGFRPTVRASHADAKLPKRLNPKSRRVEARHAVSDRRLPPLVASLRECEPQRRRGRAKKCERSGAKAAAA